MAVYASDDLVEEILLKIAKDASDDECEADALYGIGSIDFNKIIPQPPDIVTKAMTMEERAACKGRDWYTWNVANWGTKWNAYYCERIDIHVIKFSTAWDGVPEVIFKLAEMYPEAEFEYSHWDEDFGNNVCRYRIKGTEILDEEYPEDFSKEAYELIFDVEDAEPADFNMVYDAKTDNYRYADDEEEVFDAEDAAV